MTDERRYQAEDLSDLTELSRAILRGEERPPDDREPPVVLTADWSRVRSLRVSSIVSCTLLLASVAASAVAFGVNLEQRRLLQRARRAGPPPV